MNANDLSVLFTFQDFNGQTMLDKREKENLVNMYEKRINEFLNTWFIFSCNCTACAKYKAKNNANLIVGSQSVTSKLFNQIFGDKYFNNIFQYIIPRLLRFRHIIKCESNPSIDLAYKNCIEDGKIILPKVLSKTDDSVVQHTYKKIYNYYNRIINANTNDLLNEFDTVVKNTCEQYLDLNSFKPGVFPFIEENTFYNNSYQDIKEKALVIFFEIICRFIEMIDIDVYSNNTPMPQYIDGFFKIQKAFVSNNILYIFLQDSKNVLLYDFTNSLSTEEYENENVKYTLVDNVRNIYMMSLKSKVANMIYTQDNIILFLADGARIINGSNNNHKISKDDINQYIHFTDFKYTSNNISNIKIYDKHIYIVDNKGIIKIFGDPQENNPLFEDAVHVSGNEYRNSSHKDSINFSLSENETNIIYLSENSIGDFFAFDDYKIEIEPNRKVITLIREGNENLTFDITTTDDADRSISNIFRLADNAIILEYKNDDAEEYSYFILGNTNTDNRLGYRSTSFESKEEELSELHEISEYIQKNSNDEYDSSIRIKEVETFVNRTLILMENGLVFGAGKNDGYFVALSNNSENNIDNIEELDEFTLLNTTTKDVKFTGIAATKNTPKSLVLLYNDLYGYGFGSYFFLGMKNGGSFRNSNDEVIDRFDDNSIDKKSSPTFYSYFCTKNCLFYINPIFDLVSHYYIARPRLENKSIAHVIFSLLYLKDMSITYNEDAYIHIVNNLTILSEESNVVFANINYHIYNNIQNYLMHDAMLLMYSNDEEKYNSVSKFINLIGLMSENFSAMKNKKCKINDMPFDDFIRSINDINRKSDFGSEDSNGGIRYNPFRAR